MKINKWTLGLAAVGLVSLSSVTQAEEAAQPLLTALSSTTISGYVDVGAHWNPGTGNAVPAPFAFNTPTKRDGFNVNSVLVTLEKPLEEGEWSAGYRADLMWGPDAPAATGDADIRQAYVALRAPIGNGLDLKLGRWDTIIGYESTDSYKNPNYTRSYGYSIQPTEHTGLLATYQALEFLTVNAGVANTATTHAINARNSRAESRKAYMASVALTAPEDLGFLAGSALYAGAVIGDSTTSTKSQQHYYVGATLATPVEGLRLGAAFDYINDSVLGGAALAPIGGGNTDIWTAALYASFQATEKLSLHTRAEYVDLEVGSGVGAIETELFAVTATVQYDIWENVLSRLEVRWDHADDARFLGNGSKKNDWLVAANLVYKF
ncbi:MAG: outer membrane beta-barrel protein [Verrucomicrobia bacterium]|nr:outer membrane beta-barrel protein [Verrucomicrobiota bacterium]